MTWQKELDELALKRELARRMGGVEGIDPRDTRPILVDFVRRAQAINATQLGPKLRAGMRP